jgi:hypothetical protein
MTRPALLITDRGDVRDAHCPELRRELWSTDADFDLVRYVVRNIGFIEISRIGGAHRIRLCPQAVSKMALVKLFQFFAERQPARVAVSFDDDEAMDCILGNWVQALTFLDRRISVQQEGLGERFLYRQGDLAELKRRDPLSHLLARWRERGGRAELSEVTALAGRSLRRRYVVAEPSASGHALELRASGGGFATSDVGCIEPMKLTHHPDYRYGQWVNQRYRSALELGGPVLGEVDALISRPHSGVERFRYRHLLVPIRSSDGALRLLGAPVLDNSIDLRGIR